MNGDDSIRMQTYLTKQKMDFYKNAPPTPSLPALVIEYGRLYQEQVSNLASLEEQLRHANLGS